MDMMWKAWLARLNITKYTFPHFTAGLITFLLFLGIFEYTIKLLNDNQHEKVRSAIIDKTAAVRAKIGGELNSMLYLSAGLIAHVATHPKIDTTEFNQIASEIIARGRNIRNIALAKDNIISHIYPITGNEQALGLNYANQASQWPTVKKAIDLNGTVIAGPVSLVQGGQGLIIRTVIHTRAGLEGYLPNSKSSYWGLASIVIDVDGFLNRWASVRFKSILHLLLGEGIA